MVIWWGYFWKNWILLEICVSCLFIFCSFFGVWGFFVFWNIRFVIMLVCIILNVILCYVVIMLWILCVWWWRSVMFFVCMMLNGIVLLSFKNRLYVVLWLYFLVVFFLMKWIWRWLFIILLIFLFGFMFIVMMCILWFCFVNIWCSVMVCCFSFLGVFLIGYVFMKSVILRFVGGGLKYNLFYVNLIICKFFDYCWVIWLFFYVLL